jgi:TRAP-type C4-dicarboxylate transport system permease small subunit
MSFVPATDNKPMPLLQRLYGWLLKVETLLLVAVLLSLIGVAVTQIVLRNLFDSGLLWADAFTRISVLWLALLGATVGSRQRKHLAIDALVRFLPGHWKNLIAHLTDVFTGLVCFVAAWFATDFVMQESAFGDIAFAAVPNWLCETIIPVAFIVIALRYSLAPFLPSDTENKP